MPVMNFNEFARNRNNCHVAEDGFLFWKITSDETDFPCTLSADSSLMIAHIMVIDGELTVTAKNKSFVIGKNDYAHIIDCTSVEFVSMTGNLSAYVTLCTDRYTAMLLRNAHPIPPTLVLRIRQQPLDHLTDEDINRMKLRFDCIDDACRDEEHIFHNEMIRCAIWMHLMDISDLYTRHKSCLVQTTRRKELFIAFMDLLSDNIVKEHTVGFYASSLCVTPQYLNRIVKAYTEKTAYDWICVSLVGEITKRLEETNATMQLIAHELEFSDQATMEKFFKRHTGYSLTEYRKRLSAKR